MHRRSSSSPAHPRFQLWFCLARLTMLGDPPVLGVSSFTCTAFFISRISCHSHFLHPFVTYQHLFLLHLFLLHLEGWQRSRMGFFASVSIRPDLFRHLGCGKPPWNRRPSVLITRNYRRNTIPVRSALMSVAENNTALIDENYLYI